MNILFLDKDSINKGSTRIWVHNLHKWMKEQNYDVHLNKTINQSTDVVIFGKSTSNKEVSETKKTFPKILIGIINPSDAKKRSRKILKLADFYITGSIEERDYYLRYNKNTFIFPLIEDIFKNQKLHTEKDEIILSYHGNKHHLEQFCPNITKAINFISLKRKIKLIVIYDIKSTGKWKVGRPNIEIEDVQWNINTVEKELLKGDIGIVTGLNSINNFRRKLIRKVLQFTDFKHTRFVNDYIVEYKNTTNAGRAFVFHQLGIPVISDFLPSSFHILADENFGFIAHSTEAWVRAIEILSNSAEKRKDVAKNAKNLFKRNYNPHKWATKLHNEIKEICCK